LVALQADADEPNIAAKYLLDPSLSSLVHPSSTVVLSQLQPSSLSPNASQKLAKPACLVG
jgi:hypothetical protein